MKHYMGNLIIVGTLLVLVGGLLLGCEPRTTPPPPISGPEVTPPTDPSGPGDDARTRAIRLIKINLAEVDQLLRATDEAFKNGAFSDIAEHAKELVKLAKETRRLTIDLDESDAAVILLLLDRVEHDSHELEEAAERKSDEDGHHALGNLNDEVASLRDRVRNM